jgi:hypothetical protein
VSLDWLIANKGSKRYSEKVELEENVLQPEEKTQSQEKTGPDVVSVDVKELLAHMERISLLRY